MTILIAPDSFKGTYTAAEVATHIGAGIETPGPDAIRMPAADDSEGPLECLRAPMNLTMVSANSGILGGCPLRARYGLSHTALPSSSGRSRRHHYFHDGTLNPVTANTYGTGMLVVDALR
jgi:glycerate 2-kinase